MWFFMYACYILSLFSLILLITAFIQSFLQFYIFNAAPLSFIVLTSIVYLFTETLIMFFFVGTGVSIKEYTQDHQLKPIYHQRSTALKHKLYPPQLLNILLLSTAFCLLGAAETGKIPLWIYQLSLFIGIIHFIYSKITQHTCFKENTENILDMSGIQRPTISTQ